MIDQTFDFGWGPELLTKQLEADILRKYLRPFAEDDSKTIVVNNTWYGDWCHQKVVDYCQTNPVDRIVSVAMMDAPVSYRDRFQDLASDVRCVGYYSEPDDIDFWALAVDKWFRVPNGDLMDVNQIDLPFMSLNRKPHSHRQQLYDALKSENLLDRGLVSMGAIKDGDPAQRCLPQDVSISDQGLNPNPGVEQTGLVNDIMSLGHPENWYRCFLNVVTETQFNLRRIRFVSEKIYKPIMGMRPFLVYARTGAVPWLVDRGFEPYVKDFQDISDLDLASPYNLVPFLKILSDQPVSYYHHKMLDLRDKIMYNRNQFHRYVDTIKTKVNRGIQCQI